MSDQQTRRAANVLATYDMIAHDLAICPSAVLRTRLAEIEAELLALTGAKSVSQAREQLPIKPTSDTHEPAVIRAPKKTKKEKKAKLRGQDHTRNTRKPYSGRAQPVRITGVVSGGLPTQNRRRH